MNIPVEIQKKIGNAICEIIKYTLRECSLCGKKITTGRPIFNFRKPEEEKSVYIRGSIVCSECNERHPEEVDKFKRGDTFNLGIFDI